MLRSAILTLALAAMTLPSAAAAAPDATPVPLPAAETAAYVETTLPESEAPSEQKGEKDAPRAPRFAPYAKRDEDRRGAFPPPLRRPPLPGSAFSCGLADRFYGKINDDFVQVYETRVAKGKVLSDLSEAELALGAAEAGVSEEKYRALLLLSDLMSRTSRPVPVSVLASLGDGELLRLARRHAKLFADTLTEEERDSLKAEFKEALK